MSLNLTASDAHPSPGPWWARLNPFAGELRLRQGTREELLEKAGKPEELLNSHGWRRVLAFYEDRLLPAFSHPKGGPELAKARFEAGCRALALRAAYCPGPEVTERARRLLAELPRARFSDEAEEGLGDRRKARDFLADRLREARNSLAESGEVAAAGEIYELLDRLQRLSGEERERWVRQRWRAGERDAAALYAYLRFLAERGWGDSADRELVDLRRFATEALAIREGTPGGEIPERIRWNQLALAGRRAPATALLHLGLGYLGLGQPARALPYLRQAAGAELDADAQRAALFHLGHAYFATGSFAEAEEAFGRAEVAGFPSWRIVAFQALIAARMGDWTKALALFATAEAALGQEASGEFYLQWGRAGVVVGQLGEAEKRFRQALEREPRDPRAAHGLDLCLEGSGRPSEAVVFLRSFVRPEETFAPLLHCYGRALAAAGAREEALPWLRRAVERSADPHLALSLGLLLDDLDDREGLVYLEKAAAAEVGGPEVLRRLALGCRRAGHLAASRHWLDRLVSHPVAGAEVARLGARDLMSRATEAFNAGRYGEAGQLGLRAASGLGDSPQLAAWLGRVLLAAAVEEVKEAGPGVNLEQIAAAHALAPSRESRFYLAVGRFLNGAFAAASAELAGLAGEDPEDAVAELFAALAAAFADEEGVWERLAALAADRSLAELQSLLAPLGLHRALRAGRFPEAAEAFRTWLDETAGARGFALPWYQLNLLAAHTLLRGTLRRRDQVVRRFEALVAQGEPRWDLALLVARQGLQAEAYWGRPEEADSEWLSELRAAYDRLLARATTAEEGQAIVGPYSDLLAFTVAHHLSCQALGPTLEALEAARQLPAALSPALAVLGEVLARRLAAPSHEKAFTLLAADPEGARQTWQALREADPADLLALHHLACLAWTRARQALAAVDYATAAGFFAESLRCFAELYGEEGFWEAQLAKGRILQSPGKKLDEAGFAAWRQDALFALAGELLQMVAQVLAGTSLVTAVEDSQAKVLGARTLLQAFDAAGLAAELRERLSDAFARQHLDPDPTRLADLPAALERARRLIDIDPGNFAARHFLLAATTHHAEEQLELRPGTAAELATLLSRQAAHAEWLLAAHATMKGERRAGQERALAAFYEALGRAHHQEGQQGITRLNTAARNRTRDRLLLECIRDAFRKSDAALEQGLSLEAFNPRATELLANHREHYRTIESVLEQMGFAA